MGNWKRAIAIDFDGTLCENNYPDIGEPNWNVIYQAIQEQKHGAGCFSGLVGKESFCMMQWRLALIGVFSLMQSMRVFLSGKSILALLLERLELMNIGMIRL